MVIAQNELQVDSIYFDKNWKQCGKKDHNTLRVIKYGKTVSSISDFYSNGKPKFQGQWLHIDSLDVDFKLLKDLPEHKAIGNFEAYYPNGKIQIELQFTPIGQWCDTTKTCFVKTIVYGKNGKRKGAYQGDLTMRNGIVFYYGSEKGELSGTKEIKNGMYHGKSVWFYSDKSVHSVTEYVEGKKHGSSIIYYNYPDQPKWEGVYENGKLVSKRKYARPESPSSQP